MYRGGELAYSNHSQIGSGQETASAAKGDSDVAIALGTTRSSCAHTARTCAPIGKVGPQFDLGSFVWFRSYTAP